MNDTITIVRVPTGIHVPQAMYDAQERLLGRLDHVDAVSNLQALVNSTGTELIFAVVDYEPLSEDDWHSIPGDAYAGTLTLSIMQSSSGSVAHIDDVVVDSRHEGKGIGKRLMQKAIEIGHESGVHKFDLTSRPNKLAAQALYEKVGFTKRETNNWRYEG